MEKRQKIIASLVVIGLIGLLVMSAPSPKKSLSNLPSSNVDAQQVSTDTNIDKQTQAQSTSNVANDALQAQALAKANREMAASNSYLQSANNTGSATATSLPTYSPSPLAGTSTAVITNACNSSAAETASQPMNTQIQQNDTQINQTQGQISALKDSYRTPGSMYGYNANGYEAYYTSTLNAYEQQLNTLTTRKQSFMSQLQSIKMQYGC